MKNLFLALATVFSFLILISPLANAQSNVQLRVVGGNLEDKGAVILPVENGAYALGATSSHGDGTVRGYVVFYDDNFDYSWSILTPYGSIVEMISDAVQVSDPASDNIKVLSSRLGGNGTYNAVVHEVENQGVSGEIISTVEIVNPINQNTSSLVHWRGSTYAFGDMEGDGWLIDVEDDLAVASGDFYVWGHPVLTETVSSARVQNDTLYVVGSTIVNGVEQATVWVWGPDGNALWAKIAPDENAVGRNYSNDIATYEGGATLLYSYDRADLPLGHGIIKFDQADGTPGGIVSTAGPIYVEGTRLISHEDYFFKLAHINYNSGSGTDMVVTQLGQYGGYIASNSLGTDFNETPADMEIDSEGRVWIIGTTYGFLNGSASICVYRLDSTQVIGSVDAENIGLGITNDPMLYSSVGFDGGLQDVDLSIFPNPARTVARLSSYSVWSIYSSTGRFCLDGQGYDVDLSSLPAGMYFVKGVAENRPFALPLQVLN